MYMKINMKSNFVFCSNWEKLFSVSESEFFSYYISLMIDKGEESNFVKIISYFCVNNVRT